MGETRPEFKLKSPPEDAIQSIRFVPEQNNLLVAASWDSYVRLYDVALNVLRHKYQHLSGQPVLDSYMIDQFKSFSGALDGSVIHYEMNSESLFQLGFHADAVRCTQYSGDHQLLVTGSWDKTVKLWDTRSCGEIGTHPQQADVFALSVKDDLMVVGTAGRKIVVWDLRNMVAPFQQRESLLKYQTRYLDIFPNKEGYVLSSIEGRVGVEYFDPNPEIQKKKYAFKCHRVKEQGIECIYPVNAISFRADYSTFATGGSDGFVNIWDGFNKKRLCQFHRYPTGISSLAFNECGNLLAIACSYLYETDEPPNPIPDNRIYIRSVTDQETKPK